MALSDTKIKSLKPKAKKYLEADDRGLYLEVKPNGTKRWIFRFRLFDKRSDMTLGVYPDISLKAARLKRDEAKQLVADGVDPRAIKRVERLAKKQANENSFKAVALDWFSQHMLTRTAGHHSTV